MREIPAKIDCEQSLCWVPYDSFWHPRAQNEHPLVGVLGVYSSEFPREFIGEALINSQVIHMECREY